MDDLQSLNEAINKKAGRKLIPSIFVAIVILALVFGTVYLVPALFAGLLWIAVLLAIRELSHAYRAGGIDLPENILYLASTAIMLAAWYGRVTGLSVAMAVAIPNVLVYILAPEVSPKKTWEGLIGSVIATTIGAALVFQYSLDKPFWVGACVGFATVFTSTAGDLIESAVKRDLSIKDMSTLLPGHGGILDRIDSVLFTGPAIWFALEFIKHFNL